MNNTTHNNTTISELNLKSKKMKQSKKKVEDAVEEAGPTPAPKSGGPAKKSSLDKDPTSDEKLYRTGSAESGKKRTKGQVSDEKQSRESNSQDSERGRGNNPIIR